MARKRKKHIRLNVRKLLKAAAVAGVAVVIALGALVGYYALDLPDIMKSPHFERKAAITFKAADGEVIGRYGELKGISISVTELPPHLVHAVLATEDRRFYSHHGIDLVGLARAMVTNARHLRFVQGGSTITQQLAKNLFLNHERTIKRKIQEALLALWLEHKLTKDEILSAYLNRVYMGGGAYGIDAASRIYFNKPAKDLSLRESALIAGLLKAPSRYSPSSNPGLASQRARVVLMAMADAGYITEDEARSATLTTPTPRRKPTEGGGIGYFTDWVSSDLDDLIGAVDKDLVVETTFDPEIQKAAETALARHLRESGDKMNITQGAVIVMGYDGAVLAMVGGRDYALSQFNRAAQGLRPPGSSFKPIVYLTALQQGWRREDLIEDAPLKIGRYRPENYKNEYFGEVSLEEALARSLNTVAVRLAQQVGIGNVIATARALGIHADLEPDLSLALGSSGVPMLEMVGAYTVLANGGYSVAPYAVRRIRTGEGQLVYQRMDLRPARPLFDPQALAQLDRMMQTVVEYGTGRRALGPYRAAGKTGTSQDFRDAWFIGYTECCVAGVWVGNDDNSSMKSVTGGNLPAGIWRDVMTAARGRHSGARMVSDETILWHSDRRTAGGVAEASPSAGRESGFVEMLQRLFNE